MQFEKWAIRELRPMYLSLIERLKGDIGPDNCTVPFVPYLGSSFEEAKYRILFVGKATYGWGSGEAGQGSGTLASVLGRNDLYEYLAELPGRFIEEEIIPFYGDERGRYHSAFWNRIYRFTGQCLLNRPASGYKREREASEKIFRSIAWSNVFKVGALKSDRGNPNQKLISVQKEESTLHKELEVLQPDLTIFSTGPTYDHYLEEFLPKSCMKDVGPNHLRIKEVEDLAGPAFRTYHFQHYSNRNFEQVANYIIKRLTEGKPRQK